MFRPRILIGACLLSVGAVAAAQAPVVLVNGTGVPLVSLSIRSYKREPWRPVGNGSAAPSQRQSVAATSGECAYDVRASLPDGTGLVWAGVNLCDTGTITLNRRADGMTWVDYD